MIELSLENKKHVDDIIISTKWGETIEFGDISFFLWGHRNGGATVGSYICTQKHRQNYPWWRVLNRDGHPIADDVAIINLKNEGHQIPYSVIVGYNKMNPQAIIMNRNGILGVVTTAIETILRSNHAKTLSSNQIFKTLPVALQNSLSTIASSYNKGACKDPASYVGTAASMLVNGNPTSFFHDKHFYCPHLNRFDDAFRTI